MPETVRLPLRFGGVTADGYEVQVSSFHWFAAEGSWCRPGDLLGWFNVALNHKPGSPPGEHPFLDEPRDLQVGLISRVPGRLVQMPGVSKGGHLDLLPVFLSWNADTVIGHLDCPADEPDLATIGKDPVRRLFVAGRRTTEFAEVRGGLLSGWYDRSRAWWADRAGPFGTVVGLGICQMIGVLRGEQGAFLELFNAVSGPAHLVHLPDDVLVPAASVVLAGLNRTPDEVVQINEDALEAFASLLGSYRLTGPALSDWLFLGCLLKALSRSPLNERPFLLGPEGVTRAGPPNAAILTLGSDPPMIFRHRRLGYPLWCHPFRLREAGPLIRAWLKRDFDPVRRTPDDIRRDLRSLIDVLQSRWGTKVFLVNNWGGAVGEPPLSYSPFPAPLGDHLINVRTKELNLMLYDLGRERDVSVIDMDALVAEYGAGEHMPDGIHPSGFLQGVVRTRIVDMLRESGVPGFSPAASIR